MKRRARFIDLTGLVVAGATVHREAPTLRGSSRWHVTLSCGCNTIVLGSHLRQAEKQGIDVKCQAHRSYARVSTGKVPLTEAERYQIRKARTPGNRGKGTGICYLCHGLSWHVVGERCRNPNCRLEFAEETPVQYDYGARKPLAWL